MNELEPQKLESQAVSLQSGPSFPSMLEMRLADRDAEYQRRLAFLESAAATAAADTPASESFVPLLELVKLAVAQVHKEGYLILPNLLNREQTRRVRDGLTPLFEATRRMFEKLDRKSTRQTIHIQNVFAKSRVVDEVAVNPLLRAIVRGILGHDFILNAGAVAMSPDPGCSAQNLHRDDGSYSLIPRPRLPVVVTAVIALDNFREENGATQVVPGSCCWPPSREPTPEEVTPCAMSAGSLLLYDGAIFHRGGANKTVDETRRTLTLNYTRGWLRTQFNHFLSIPRELILTLPPALQSDLGYHLSARGLGGCDNQDPLTYLKRMFAGGGDGTQPMLGREVDDRQALDQCTSSRSAKSRQPMRRS